MASTTTTQERTWIEQAVFDVLDDGQQQRPTRAEEWNIEYHFDDTLRFMEEEEQQQQQQRDGNDNDLDSSEQRLSQRLSQLSAKDEYETEPPTNGKRRRVPMLQAATTKRSRTSMEEETVDDDEDARESKTWPAYLLAKNHIFDRLVRTSASTHASTIDMEDLRQLALLVHRTAEFQLSKELWSAYSKSGAGQLGNARSTTRHDQPFWPEHVEKYVARQHRSTLPADMNEGDKQRTYERLVSQRQAHIDAALTRYQQQHDALKQALVGFTSAMEGTLNTIVHQLGIVPLRWVIDAKLATLRFDYQDHQLQYQYQQEQPNRYQVPRNIL